MILKGDGKKCEEKTKIFLRSDELDEFMFFSSFYS